MGDIQKALKIVAVISLKKLRNMLAVLRGLSACQVVCEIMISPRAQLGIPLMLTALDLVKLIASARERKPRRIFIHENIVHRHTPSGSLSTLCILPRFSHSHKIIILILFTYLLKLFCYMFKRLNGVIKILLFIRVQQCLMQLLIIASYVVIQLVFPRAEVICSCWIIL